jgi:hypothetical protein
MTTALFIVAVVAGLACPAHMLWRMRRTEDAAKVAPPLGDLGELRRRRTEIQARIDAADRREREPASR